jgi:hypothetical protein
MTLRWARSAVALAVLLVAGAGCLGRPDPEKLQAWNADLHRLQAEQDSLRVRAAELVAQDPRIRSLPQGDVVLCVPTAFLRSVIERVFDDVATSVTLSLSGIKAHVAKSIKKVVPIGDYVVDVEITEVVGKLRPGQPDIEFGGNQVSMSLPVELSEGHGAAKIHFVWNGKNVAGATCGDMDVNEKVSGTVIPSSYLVSGKLRLEVRGTEVVCVPVFPETKLRIRVKPSQQSWDRINAILAEKSGVCGWVLNKVNVPELLTNFLEVKGFNVKLPVHKLKPFVLPAGVTESVAVGGQVLSISSQTKLIRIDPDAVWYTASVAVKPQ